MQQYSIRQLLDVAKTGFNEIFYDFHFWCIAEIVSVKRTKKAIFLECIESDGTGEILAKCTFCIFTSALLENFYKSTALQDSTLQGQKILCKGHFSLYEDRIRIIVDEISSSYTLGNVVQSQNNIRDTLIREGIYENNKKTDIGFPKYNIAIISSKSSDGLEDFFDVLHTSCVQYTYTLYDTLVHGNEAKSAVYKSLQQIYCDIKDGKQYNAVCLIRGGGDTAGILWQNDIDIARGVCYMPVPVIIAIGHTKDKTILDEICYESANTPTFAAQIFIKNIDELSSYITNQYGSINQLVYQKIISYEKNIEKLYGGIRMQIANRYNTLLQHISSLYNMIQIYHPDSILRKGYALVRHEDHILQAGVIPLIGDTVEIETSTIIISATVDSVATKE